MTICRTAEQDILRTRGEAVTAQETRVREIEQQREGLSDSLAARVAELRALEEQTQDLRVLHARIAAADEGLARADQRIDEIERARPDVPRDSLTPSNLRVEQTAGLHRLRNAGIATVGGAAITA